MKKQKPMVENIKGRRILFGNTLIVLHLSCRSFSQTLNSGV